MSERMTKFFVVVFTIFVFGVLAFVYYEGEKAIEKKELLKNLEKKSFAKSQLVVRDSKYGMVKEIYNQCDELTPFYLSYQEAVDEKIEELLKDDYSFQQPLMIYNPYGTNKNSINLYFKTEEAYQVEYVVQVKGLPDFARTLKNDGEDELVSDHRYQLIGLVVGRKNTLVLKLKNAEGEVVDEKSWELDLRGISSSVATQLNVKDGESLEELSDGLYVMFGHDKKYNANNYLYDNDGVLRSELVLEGYRSDCILFREGSMIYSYSNNGLIEVNRLGKIIRKYQTTGYTMHHDYILDEKNENILVLANKNNADTIEDRVLAINLTTGKVKELIDMKDYMREFYDHAFVPKQNTYGGSELDWVHLNSFDIIDGEDMVLSSRELSTVIYMENIYRNPKIKYVLTDSSTLKGTSYQDLNYEKIGDFVSQAGQHTITYQEKDGDNQYYLYMYNNNYQGARTRPKFNWKNYPGTGTYQEGEVSHYYKYLVDEEKKTYELVKKIDLPYSSIVSSVEHVEDHFVTSSGMSHCFNEYDQDGKMIKQFNYTSKKYAYRIFKYTFQDIWFS